MKTLYSVKYRSLGALTTSTMWFEDFRDAKLWASLPSSRCCDNPVVHNYKDEEKIKAILEIIKEETDLEVYEGKAQYNLDRLDVKGWTFAEIVHYIVYNYGLTPKAARLIAVEY